MRHSLKIEKDKFILILDDPMKTVDFWLDPQSFVNFVQSLQDALHDYRRVFGQLPEPQNIRDNVDIEREPVDSV